MTESEILHHEALYNFLKENFYGSLYDMKFWPDCLKNASEEEYNLAYLFLNSTAANGLESIGRAISHWVSSDKDVNENFFTPSVLFGYICFNAQNYSNTINLRQSYIHARGLNENLRDYYRVLYGHPKDDVHNNFDTKFNNAVDQYNHGKHEDAFEIFDKLLAEDMKSPHLYCARGGKNKPQAKKFGFVVPEIEISQEQKDFLFQLGKIVREVFPNQKLHQVKSTNPDAYMAFVQKVNPLFLSQRIDIFRMVDEELKNYKDKNL